MTPDAETHLYHGFYVCFMLDVSLDVLCAVVTEDVTGGGRIDVLRDEKKVQIYGYSYQYGAADHSITAKMMKDHLGEDFLVSFGNYGY